MAALIHPHEKDLALLAGGDAGRWERFLLDRHVRGCAACQEKVAEFRELRESIAEAAETPNVNWSLLEAEMRANIHLGFEAGQCVRGVKRGWAWDPRLAVALACLLLLAGASWFLRAPHSLTAKVDQESAVSAISDGPVLESTDSGLELRSGGGSLTLLNRHGVMARQTVSARGEIDARYVDGEAGTVTINHVYLQ